MYLRKFCFSLTASLTAFVGLQAPACAAPSTATKPNIVVIMADDLGKGDIGFYHKQRTGKDPIIPTPNLNDLIQVGMRFSDAHSPAALCAPSRYAMLTGNFPFRSGHINGVWHPYNKSGIEPNSTTSARIAKQGGYNTAFFGKWGLGEAWTSKKHSFEHLDRGATYFGFDYALELPDGIQNSPLAFYEQKKFMPLAKDSKMAKITLEQAKFTGKGGRKLANVMMGDSAWDPALAGPVLAQHAVEYIERQDKKTPFFIYYCTQAVHIPHTPPEELDGKKIKGQTPSSYGDMVLELDTQVGMIVKALKKTGHYDNTLIVFTSDNGGLGDKFTGTVQKLGHLPSNGLRQFKGSIYEGGHRVPFIAAWPNVIPANSESNELIVSHDIVATIAALAKQPLNRDKVKDSLNLLPILTNSKVSERHKFISHQAKNKPGALLAIREGDWKLIMKTPNPNKLEALTPTALFNLKENPSESEAGNRVKDAAQAERIHKLRERYIEHRTAGTPSVSAIH